MVVVVAMVAMVAMVVARVCLLMMRPTKSKNLVLEGVMLVMLTVVILAMVIYAEPE